MTIGIAGDSIITVNGLPLPDLDTIELRTISQLLQTFLAAGSGQDSLTAVRNDQAFELQIPTPLPGAGR